jgi:hypothetical protein
MNLFQFYIFWSLDFAVQHMKKSGQIIIFIFKKNGIEIHYVAKSKHKKCQNW